MAGFDACPHCQKEIKLTESLAAPLVAATRQQFEARLAQKDAEVARYGEQEQALATARKKVAADIALRQSLIEVAAVLQNHEGQRTKMGLVYQYLTGPRFRAHVESIVERFTEMEEDLAKERRTITRLWAKREEQIHGVIGSTATMYGDPQGIAGKSLCETDGLEIGLLSRRRILRTVHYKPKLGNSSSDVHETSH